MYNQVIADKKSVLIEFDIAFFKAQGPMRACLDAKGFVIFVPAADAEITVMYKEGYVFRVDCAVWTCMGA